MAFSPDNESGFKRVVMVLDRTGVRRLGFLTREFELCDLAGAQPLVAVYVPTNHLYLGDVYLYRPDSVVVPDLTVEEGLRILLTGGTAVPLEVTGRPLVAVSERRGDVSEPYRYRIEQVELPPSRLRSPWSPALARPARLTAAPQEVT